MRLHARTARNASGCWEEIGKSARLPGSISSGSGVAVVDEVPVDLDVVRYWDLAAAERAEFNDGAMPLALLSLSVQPAASPRLFLSLSRRPIQRGRSQTEKPQVAGGPDDDGSRRGRS
jgi:hypothetical protein